MAILQFSALLVCLCSAIVTASDLPKREEEIVSRYLHLLKNATFEKLYYETFIKGQENRVKRLFDCPVLPPSPSVPTSVHALRPGDINVVAAMGDSITAGRGASMGVLGLLQDFRGTSWSVGGNDGNADLNTLANILKNYNPGIKGFSTGSGSRDGSNSHLNVARSGDESKHMLEQAVMLVQRMREDPTIDMDNDWKVITLFIGGNDLCDYCSNTMEFSPEMYKVNIRSALDYLQENVPRAFVNLVEVINIELYEDVASGLLCSAVHIYACNCASNPRNSAARTELIAAKEAYRRGTIELAYSGRYDTRDDFTVVLQPFYRDTTVPRKADGKIDYSYFAADCFHHSEKGQEAAGEALWNNMVEPLGSKRTEWMAGENLECPTEGSPYFYTSKNSNSMHVVGTSP